jgi:hypothetical protein
MKKQKSTKSCSLKPGDLVRHCWSDHNNLHIGLIVEIEAKKEMAMIKWQDDQIRSIHVSQLGLLCSSAFF